MGYRLASGKLKDRTTAFIDSYLTRRFPIEEIKLLICDKNVNITAITFV